MRSVNAALLSVFADLQLRVVRVACYFFGISPPRVELGLCFGLVLRLLVVGGVLIEARPCLWRYLLGLDEVLLLGVLLSALGSFGHAFDDDLAGLRL